MKNILYVANLPPESDEAQLRELFTQHGEVTSVEFGLDEKSQVRYALVQMSVEKMATIANNSLNGYKLNDHYLAISYPDADLTRELLPKQRKMLEAIAAELGEIHKKPVRMLEAMIRLCGGSFLQGILKDTLETEARGGLMTVREPIQRRTKGGVFFYLARYRMSPPIRYIVYNRKGKYPLAQEDQADSETTLAENAE